MSTDRTWRDHLAIDDAEVNFRMREDGVLLLEVEVDEHGSTVVHELDADDQRDLVEWLGARTSGRWVL